MVKDEWQKKYNFLKHFLRSAYCSINDAPSIQRYKDYEYKYEEVCVQFDNHVLEGKKLGYIDNNFDYFLNAGRVIVWKYK